MSEIARSLVDLPPAQQAIRAKCFHPSGTFIPFEKGDIEESIPSRFEKIVEQFPLRIAVKTRNQTITYAALNERANRLARAILARRGEGEEPVALLFDEGIAGIAAILGVLKAGKIEVFLNPSHPHARTRYMLEDSQSALILTNDENLSLARELARNEIQILNINDIGSRESAGNIELSISPDALAYIRYTSGSTGQPKGVMQNHRNVLHRIMNYTNNLHICADDRLSPVRNIFIGLLNGAGLFMWNVKEQGLAQLADWLIREKITIYFSVPSVFRHFGAVITGGQTFPNLRLIVLEGEPVSEGDVESYKKHLSPRCLLLNNLGSTEVSPYRQYFIDKETKDTSNILPAGYAVEGNEILLLDDAGKEVGINETGEIVVRSRYLALGYWRRPDLTQVAFLPDLYGGEERIYHTGDLGRMLPDGCLFYLGRKDFQVKVRGNKVEPAEIEMALLSLDMIKEAVVVARQDRPGDQRLVAYVVMKQPSGTFVERLLAYIVPARGQAPTSTELRRFLKAKLPEYMVPSTFVFLEALPLTPNGKLDRKALPAPDQSRPELDNPVVAPRTAVENTLAGFWAEALSLDQVGIHDNFFELGGNSLLATQAISRINDAFNVNLSPQSLYETQTVAELAITVIQGQAGSRS